MAWKIKKITKDTVNESLAQDELTSFLNDEEILKFKILDNTDNCICIIYEDNL